LKLFKDRETVDLQRIDPRKDLSKTSSCLEFLIVALSRNLSLNPK
jgi:hypothetical protein